VNARNTIKRTPLHYAASRGHTEIVKLLLGRGADVNARDYFDYTPLGDASPYPETAALLRQYGGVE
jgi:ankyrin repeat protein